MRNEKRKEQQKEYYQKNRLKLIEKSREWYYKNHERNLVVKKEWYQKNRDRELERRKQYHYDHREEMIGKARIYYQKNKEEIKIKNKKYREVNSHWINAKKRIRGRELNQERKLQIINHYSNGSNSCVQCGIKDLDVLTVDHVYGKGTKHRKIIKKNFYQWIFQNDFPKGFQILCFNCNWKKGLTK